MIEEHNKCKTHEAFPIQPPTIIAMRLIPNVLLTYTLLLSYVAASSTIENDFTMDVLITDNDSYELRPHRRRLSSAPSPPDSSCEEVSACEVCSSGQRENEPLCKATGRVQRFKCKPLGKSSYTLLITNLLQLQRF